MMTTQIEIIWKDLQGLGEDDQQELLARLMERFEPDDGIDEELIAELHRRGEEFRLDPSVGIPWEQVREKR